MIEEVSGKGNLVLGVGGGAVCQEFGGLRERNIKNLKGNGEIILLRAKPEVIFSRMQNDAKTKEQRPSLTNKGPFDEIFSKLEERKIFYEAVSDFLVDTSDLTINEVVDEIMKYLKTMANF